MFIRPAALVQITDQRYGALVVIVVKGGLGEEVIACRRQFVLGPARFVYSRSSAVHAVVNRYHLDREELYAALFYSLPPDTYRVYGPGCIPPGPSDELPDRDYTTVTVPVGVVIEVTFVMPPASVLAPADRGRVSLPRELQRQALPSAAMAEGSSTP